MTVSKTVDKGSIPFAPANPYSTSDVGLRRRVFGSAASALWETLPNIGGGAAYVYSCAAATSQRKDKLMYKNLYDKFVGWFNEGQVFFYSDPHFGDEEIREVRKDHPSDEELIKRINAKVGKNDTIVILGDIGDVECVKKIRGYKVLVMGNHDKGASNYIKIEEVLAKEDVVEEFGDNIEEQGWKKVKGVPMLENKDFYYYNNHLFDEVYEGPLFISDRILLSHEPILFPWALNIHGHDHSNTQYNDEFHLNVCAEIIDYTPVSLKEIITSGKLRDIKDFHRATIDNRTKEDW